MSTKQLKLNRESLAKLAPSTQIHWFKSHENLGVYVGANGKRVWRVRLNLKQPNGKTRRKIGTLGLVEHLSIDEAVEVQLGKGHPQANAAGWQYEHRLVMEAHLERRLATYEEVHHLDGNRSHNELLNLELVEKIDHATYHAVYKPRDVFGRFKPEEGDLDLGFAPPGHASLIEVPF